MGGMIECLKCGQVLHSMHRHDFQMCSCENQSFVDGGFDYMRVGGKDINKLIERLDHEHVIDASDQSTKVIIKNQ